MNAKKAATTSPKPVTKVAETETTTKMAVVRKGRKPVDPNESREQKLIRLANKRVTAACKYIRLIGNLATYQPTALQIQAIERALGESSASTINRLNNVREESITFTLQT